MISTSEYCAETEALLDAVYQRLDQALGVKLPQELFDLFLAQPDEKKCRAIERAAEDSASIMFTAEQVFGRSYNIEVARGRIKPTELQRAILGQVLSLDRAVEHLKQLLLEAYSAIVSPVETHEDGSFCIDSLFPLQPSDIAQLIIDTVKGPQAPPEEPPASDFTVDI